MSDTTSWLLYGGLCTLVVAALGVRLFLDLRLYYRKCIDELKGDEPKEKSGITWGGDGQRDKVVFRDPNGFVSNRLVLLFKEELHAAAERTECALVAAAMSDWNWCVEQLTGVAPELSRVLGARERLQFALAIVLQSAIAHGDQKLARQARRGLDAFKRKVPHR